MKLRIWKLSDKALEGLQWFEVYKLQNCLKIRIGKIDIFIGK